MSNEAQKCTCLHSTLNGVAHADECPTQDLSAQLRRIKAVSNEANKPSTAELTTEQAIKAWRDVQQFNKELGYNQSVVDYTIAALERLQRLESRESGWLVENGDNNEGRRYRTMDEYGPTWTEDHTKAIRFSRRADAEMFAAGDKEAWKIVEHTWEGAKP